MERCYENGWGGGINPYILRNFTKTKQIRNPKNMNRIIAKALPMCEMDKHYRVLCASTKIS